MIGKAIKSIKEALIPNDITVNMDGGVGGSWKVECYVDDERIDCAELKETETQTSLLKKKSEHFKQSFTGIPAPAYLEDDPWFGPAPELTEKQKEYKQQEAQERLHNDLRREREQSMESDDIHQRIYEIATKNWNTVEETQIAAQGGSENFHEGPGGWSSGTGLGQFK